MITLFFFIFRDIFSAISNGSACKLLQNLLVQTIKANFPDVEAIVGLEARGFLFSFSLAAELGVGCLPVRKKGKLPGEVETHKYDLEYGSVIIHNLKDNHIVRQRWHIHIFCCNNHILIILPWH